MLLEARVAQPVTEAEAVRLARELYGIETTARALPGEYDDNFHLTTNESLTPTQPGSADGHAFVLKVMHPAREHSFIDLQCQALRHLAHRAPQFPLPRRMARRGSSGCLRLFRAKFSPKSARIRWSCLAISAGFLGRWTRRCNRLRIPARITN